MILPPPYKNKTIEFIRLIPKRERHKRIAEAGYNTFLLKSKDVFIDLLTDSGTSAMSDDQWAGLMKGDEAYAGSENFFHLEKAVKKIFGYKYVVPTHQGRGAEHVLARILIKNGDTVPNNMYFTTSRFHQELAGGKWTDVGVAKAYDPTNTFPFKGNIDIDRLLKIIKKYGAGKIAFVRIEASLNMAGGQPFSLENLKEVSRICRKNKIFLLLDATRVSENAYFIKKREAAHSRRSLRDIIFEICSLTDGCTMSAKKDHYVNIGGFLAVNDAKIFEKAKETVVGFEGLHTYGGLAGRDMEALAVGMRESARENIVGHYIGQIEYLGGLLRSLGIPIVEPSGAHGVFIDAAKFIPHLPKSQFPAQTLSSEIYVESGVRSMERGVVSGQHGRDLYDGLELVRLALPRRVYETAHLDYVAKTIGSLWNRREKVRGLKMIYEPSSLRFFQARFKKT